MHAIPNNSLSIKQRHLLFKKQLQEARQLEADLSATAKHGGGFCYSRLPLLNSR
jgi:hypothetical protein